jgi:hypothetical protein
MTCISKMARNPRWLLASAASIGLMTLMLGTVTTDTVTDTANFTTDVFTTVSTAKRIGSDKNGTDAQKRTAAQERTQHDEAKKQRQELKELLETRDEIGRRNIFKWEKQYIRLKFKLGCDINIVFKLLLILLKVLSRNVRNVTINGRTSVIGTAGQPDYKWNIIHIVRIAEISITHMI